MIEIETARDVLLRAVATQGRAFVYNPDGIGMCTYTARPELSDDTDPRRITGCLVGVALDLAGEQRHHGVPGNVDSLRRQFPDMLSDQTRDYLWAAQKVQDNGGTWGVAFDTAEALYRSDIEPTL